MEGFTWVIRRLLRGFLPKKQDIDSSPDMLAAPPPPPPVPTIQPRSEVTIPNEWLPAINHIREGENVFIAGQAGTGKSTLIRYIRQSTACRVVALAPTGIAALTLRGQTIHSFCHFPPQIITTHHIHSNANNVARAQAVDILIIDEISMVRCDLLDGLDKFMRANGRDSRLPFGGCQVVFVGDPLQLSPVVKPHDIPVLQNMGYHQFSFWGSHAWRGITPIPHNLTAVHRQAADPAFLGLLGRIRWGEIAPDDLTLLNSRVTMNTPINPVPFRPTLTPRRARASSINSFHLQHLPGPVHHYEVELTGTLANVKANAIPCDQHLRLKVSAPVMFIKNNAPAWYNGTIGIVRELSQEYVIVELPLGNHVTVHREVWEDVRYQFVQASGDLTEHIAGTARQFPLTLAWALTINKAQGLGFDHLHVDFSGGAFAGGQVYVALSRCHSLHGLTLAQPLHPNNIMVDQDAVRFMTELGFRQQQ